MRRFWHRYVGSLTSGVRATMFVMTAAYFAAWVGRITHAYGLEGWLALTPAAFWGGRVWTVLTYALLPTGMMDFVFNLLLIGWLGPYVESVWSRWELWMYCSLATVGSGMAKLLLARFDGTIMIGAMPIVYALIVAWMRLRGHEQVQLLLLGETTVLVMGSAILVISTIFLWLNAGIVNAVVLLAGALCGWLYLSVRWRLNRMPAGQQLESQRMRRLEL
jgi:membrane associated rhomboid family serine protease